MHSDAPVKRDSVEPWLRGTVNDLPALHRAVVHALQLAEEDLQLWCGELSSAEMNARPAGLVSVAFHLRHIARSVDRLLSYAEGKALSEQQRVALASERALDARPDQVFEEVRSGIARAMTRIKALADLDPEIHRAVGNKKLPTRLGGLLVHVADHTQRHVGQAITTAKLVKATRI